MGRVSARRDRTHESYHSMVERCKPGRRDGQHYFERGIRVCPRWAPRPAPNGEGFHNFLADMGERPDGATLDRIDNDRGYSPDNCRWVDQATQVQNSRAAKLTWDDVRTIRSNPGAKVKDLARQYGVSTVQISNVLAHRSWKE